MIRPTRHCREGGNPSQNKPNFSQLVKIPKRLNLGTTKELFMVYKLIFY